MFTGQPLGFLTTHLPHEGNKFVGVFEVSIPLLEGGILYHGLFSPVDSQDTPDLLFFASSEVLNTAHVEKLDLSEYRVGLGKPEPTEEILTVRLNTSPDDPQQFFGTVTKESTEERVKFVYRDIREPITIGAVTIIVVGVAGLLCVTSLVIGKIMNRECKKAEVTYGFDFDWKGKFKLGCNVKCLDQ